MDPNKIAAKPGKYSVYGMSLNLSPNEKANLSYYCPMHPNEKSDKERKCLNCDMTLKKSQKTIS